MWRKYVDKGLWLKEFWQARMMLWAMLVLGFGLLPLLRMERWWFRYPEWIAFDIDRFKREGLSYYINIGDMFEGFMLVMCILAAILSLLQMGYERRTGYQEFTLSLPYSRRAIYTTKWLMGISFIAGVTFIAVLLDILVIVSSPLAPYMDWSAYMKPILPLLLLVMISYSGTLFIGAVAGSWKAQIVFTGIMIFLPVYVAFMLTAPIQAFQLESFLYGGEMNRQSFYSYLWNPLMNDPLSRGITLILLISVLFISGMLAYERNRAENNGKLVTIPGWEKVLIVGVVICVGLLGGYTAYYKISYSLGAYMIGFLIAAAIGYLVIKTMTRMRMKG